MAEKHQKKKKGSALKILLVVLLLLVLTVGAAGVFAYNEINGNGGKPGAEVTVSIPQGSGVAAIAKELKEAGVIRSAICSAGMWGTRVPPENCSMVILRCKPADIPTMA